MWYDIFFKKPEDLRQKEKNYKDDLDNLISLDKTELYANYYKQKEENDSVIKQQLEKVTILKQDESIEDSIDRYNVKQQVDSVKAEFEELLFDLKKDMIEQKHLLLKELNIVKSELELFKNKDSDILDKLVSELMDARGKKIYISRKYTKRKDFNKLEKDYIDNLDENYFNRKEK